MSSNPMSFPFPVCWPHFSHILSAGCNRRASPSLRVAASAARGSIFGLRLIVESRRRKKHRSLWRPDMDFALKASLVTLVLFAGMTLCLEIGRRIGARRLAEGAEAAAGIGAVEGAIFALL